MQYEYLDHTADAKIKAYGKLEKAFENAVLATFNIITDIKKVQPKIKKQIELETDNKKQLLYDFIDEALFFLDTEGLIFCKAKINIKENKLTATLEGDYHKNYEVHGNVKSMTYSDMEITDNYVQFVVDL